MTGDFLAQRRRWFRHFPEGTIEFCVATRVLALLLAGALLVLPTAQRPYVLITLAGMIWLDYALVLWWVIQIQTDTALLERRDPASASSSDRVTALLIALLPSVMAVLLVSPWPVLFVSTAAARANLTNILVPVLVGAYLISLWPALVALRRSCVSDGLTRVLLLIPVLHWFGIHRFVRQTHLRLRRLPSAEVSEPGPAVTIADVTLLLTLIFLLADAVLLRNDSVAGPASSSYLSRALEFLALGFGGLFAISDVAAMETVQRAFTQLLRNRA